MTLVPTILCGGAGSRLWPVSRELHPKPFIRLADGQSLLQKAWLRATALADVKEVLTVTNRELIFKTEDEYSEVAGPAASIRNRFILEPMARNTAPAIAAAALEVAATHGEATIMLVLAADHLITDMTAFVRAVDEARALAQQGRLVTFGIEPESPETGYGYIEANGHEVLRFVEKPGLEQAVEYVASGRFLWNSGMFCFAAGTLLREMELHCPEILAATRRAIDASRRSTGNGISRLELESRVFAEVKDDSIDYALMEKSSNVAVVRCNIGWSDVGSWAALGDIGVADASGNRIEGEVVLRDVSNCFIQGSGRLIGAVGVKNLAVIDTPDALLIVDRSQAQDVKHLYAELKVKGHEAYKVHRTVHRPWGTYTVLEEGPGFKIKRIEVKPGASLSLQMHHHRSEHWIVISGAARVINGERELDVAVNESTYITAGSKHRLQNLGTTLLVMIEVQTGSYLGEDDIVRFDDQYGRVAASTEKAA